MADHFEVLHRSIRAFARLERASEQAQCIRDMYARLFDEAEAGKPVSDLAKRKKRLDGLVRFQSDLADPKQQERQNELSDAVDAAVDVLPELREVIVPPPGQSADQCMMQVGAAILAVASGDSHGLSQIQALQKSLTLQLNVLGGTKAVLTDEWAREEAKRVSQRAAELRECNAKPAAGEGTPEQDERVPMGFPVPPARHSSDFTFVYWFGTEHTFTKTQAACVRVLWEEWEKKTPALSEETIIEKAGSQGSRLRDVFKSKKKGIHEAWGTMIVEAGKGSFQLQERGKSQPPGKPHVAPRWPPGPM